MLGAKIALAKKDNDGAIAHAAEAVAIQDTLKYGEPPDWFFPVRESLGAVLLMNGDNAGAEKVFREDLDHNPRNPRSLCGLQQALKAAEAANTMPALCRSNSRLMERRGTALKMDDLV